jgi:hypothetical protein
MKKFGVESGWCHKAIRQVLGYFGTGILRISVFLPSSNDDNINTNNNNYICFTLQYHIVFDYCISRLVQLHYFELDAASISSITSDMLWLL